LKSLDNYKAILPTEHPTVNTFFLSHYKDEANFLMIPKAS
jgi:hypothetical protein